MKRFLQITAFVAAAAVCVWIFVRTTSLGRPDTPLDFAIETVERAYAGFEDKVRGREDEYAALKERLGEETEEGRDPYDAASEYLGWFDDFHLAGLEAGLYRPKSKNRPAYAERMVRYAPQAAACRVDDDTYLIRFPSCALDEEGAEALRANVRDYLASGCDNLVIDIRGNGGGNDGAFAPLQQLLYDREASIDGVEFRASDVTHEFLCEFADRDEILRSLAERVDRSPEGAFVPLFEGEEGLGRIKYDSVSPLPRRAAIVIDGGVASSGEQMVLNIKACSGRTTVYGRDNTMGCLDFSNCLTVRFPQDSARHFQIPVSRSYRVAEGRGIDEGGIAPDVRIPLELPDSITDNVDPWIEWVARDMKNRK